jgi:hypothetical protein
MARDVHHACPWRLSGTLPSAHASRARMGVRGRRHIASARFRSQNRATESSRHDNRDVIDRLYNMRPSCARSLDNSRGGERRLAAHSSRSRGAACGGYGRMSRCPAWLSDPFRPRRQRRDTMTRRGNPQESPRSAATRPRYAQKEASRHETARRHRRTPQCGQVHPLQ